MRFRVPPGESLVSHRDPLLNLMKYLLVLINPYSQGDSPQLRLTMYEKGRQSNPKNRNIAPSPKAYITFNNKPVSYISQLSMVPTTRIELVT